VRLVLGLVFLASLWVLFSPGSDTPSLAISDKLVHASLFAALALTGLLARVPLHVLAPVLVAYAGLSEVLQAILPIDRDGDWHDALADTVGTAIGLLLALAWLHSRQSGRPA
jgi:VanZ family protein